MPVLVLAILVIVLEVEVVDFLSSVSVSVSPLVSAEALLSVP